MGNIKMEACLVSALLLACLQAPLIVGQCVINHDEGNVVATQLEGHWVNSEEVNAMLGNDQSDGESIKDWWISKNDSVLEIMDDFCSSLGAYGFGDVYMAGYTSYKNEVDLPFILTTFHGNPHFVFYLGHPMMPFESGNVMLARGTSRSKDLFFAGGDDNKYGDFQA